MKGIHVMANRGSVIVLLTLLGAIQGCARHAILPPETALDGPLEDPPRGMLEVNVVSDDDRTWDVYAGGKAICTTPCTQWFRAQEGLLLESNDGDSLYVHSLGLEAMQAKRAMLIAEGACYGKRINGIVFTTFGGMGMVTAIALSAVGCSDLDQRRGMCTAGLITGAVAVPVTAFALWMLLDAHPRAHVLPVFKTRAAHGQPSATIAIGPNGVAGTF